MKIRRSLLIILAVFGLYFALFFAVMERDVPVWKDGRFVNTCAVRWVEVRPFMNRLGLTVVVRPWHFLNAVFQPAEQTINALRGCGSREEHLSILNEQLELRTAYWHAQELIEKEGAGPKSSSDPNAAP
jgi:hypothetical protein